jgi:deoxyadenosine/deoxycytidine kinase
MENRYIAIEGPIGVGKTSLARLLSERLGARLLVEDVEENPFLARFYDDPQRYAFQTQLFFLFSRYRQQQAGLQQDLFHQTTISDYIFEKDRLFAAINLSDDELALYDQIYALLDPRVPRPDLVIYLQASVRVLLERVRRRGKDYERGLGPAYLEKLCAAYNNYFFRYNHSPLLVINTDGIDFIHSRGDFEELVREVRQFRGGVQYFNPLGSR